MSVSTVSNLTTPFPLNPISTRFPKDLSEMKDLPIDFKESCSQVKKVQDTQGVSYILKRSKAEGHIKSEYEAYLCLRHWGVPVADSEYYSKGYENQDALLVKFIPNAKPLRNCLSGDFKKDRALCLALRESLYAFLLIGGWDMLGLQINNVLVNESGKHTFIDFGAAFNFRANGFKKDGRDPTLSFYVQNEVKEFETMINSSLQAGIFYLLSDLSPEDLRILLLEQANKIDISSLLPLVQQGLLSQINYDALKNRHENVLGSTDGLKKYLPHFTANMEANKKAIEKAAALNCLVPLRDPPSFGMTSYEVPALVKWNGVIHEVDNENPNNDPVFETEPSQKAIQVSAIVKELGLESIWLEKKADSYRLITIDVARENSNPVKSLVWKVIMDLGKKVGQIGIRKDFIHDVENETTKRRIYLAERGGGNGGNTELVSLNSALNLLSDEDKAILLAYKERISIK